MTTWIRIAEISITILTGVITVIEEIKRGDV